MEVSVRSGDMIGSRAVVYADLYTLPLSKRQKSILITFVYLQTYFSFRGVSFNRKTLNKILFHSSQVLWSCENMPYHIYSLKVLPELSIS